MRAKLYSTLEQNPNGNKDADKFLAYGAAMVWGATLLGGTAGYDGDTRNI